LTDENGLLNDGSDVAGVYMTAEQLVGMQEMLKQFGTDGWKIGKGRF